MGTSLPGATPLLVPPPRGPRGDLGQEASRTWPLCLAPPGGCGQQQLRLLLFLLQGKQADDEARRSAGHQGETGVTQFLSSRTLLTTRVTLGRLLSLSEPQFPLL